jgi:hypothetical protein
MHVTSLILLIVFGFLFFGFLFSVFGAFFPTIFVIGFFGLILSTCYVIIKSILR